MYVSFWNWYYKLTGFPGGALVKEPTCQWRRSKTRGFDPGLRRSIVVGNDNPLQYSCWAIPWTADPGGLSSWGCKTSVATERLSTCIKKDAWNSLTNSNTKN